MAAGPTFERVLQRDRTITLVGLAVLCLLAWLYTVTGAGLGMSARAMTTLALFPHEQAADMPRVSVADWAFTTWLLMIAMWWTMMIAMMTPSAAPAILLYARVHRHAVAQSSGEERVAPTGAFALGYLSIWLLFSIAATVLYWALERVGLVTVMMGSGSRWLSAAVLIAAGLYQLSAFKHVCLAHCHAPASFLSRHWRPHAYGALRLGAMHGAHCLGCCWLLMALLFVGGVMNLIWIAALSILVLLEKALSAGKWLGRAVGIMLIGWGIATLLV